MSLPYSPSRAVYQGNDAATSFPFAFKIWSADQLAVGITSPEGVSSQAQGWTVSLSESGGSVTYLHEAKPLPTGWRLAIIRAMPFSQTIDLVSASRFDPQVIEDGLDQAAAERQELNEKIARAVILPATSDQSPEEVVAAIHANRDAAAASASTAQTAATAAAESASMAESTVQMATTAAIAAATTQATAAAASATAAQASAATAYATSEGMADRVAAEESKNTEQDARLTAVEAVNTQQSAHIATNTEALAGKANADLSNVTVNAMGIFFHARDVKPTGTDGGTSASAAWQTRDLNTVVEPQAWASLSANRVTLQAGKYYIRAATPAMAPFTARAAIYDVTHGGYLLFGPTIYGNTYDGTYPEPVEGIITLSATTELELRQFTGQAVGGYGLGRAGTSGLQEIYSEFRAWPIQQ